MIHLNQYSQFFTIHCTVLYCTFRTTAGRLLIDNSHGRECSFYELRLALNYCREFTAGRKHTRYVRGKSTVTTFLASGISSTPLTTASLI